MPKLPDKTKDDIVKWLQEGNSQHSAKAKFGVSGNIVSKLAKENNIKPPEAKAAQTKNAIAHRQFYTKEKRMALYDKFLDRCWKMIEEDDITPHQIQALSIAIGTMADKIRMDENASDKGKYEFQELMDRIRKNDKLLST